MIVRVIMTRKVARPGRGLDVTLMPILSELLMELRTIANHQANVATNRFKRGGVVFEDLMYDSLRQVGAASSDQTQLPTGLQVGLGTRVSASTRNFSQGNLQQTGNNLDLAIKGQGFF